MVRRLTSRNRQYSHNPVAQFQTIPVPHMNGFLAASVTRSEGENQSLIMTCTQGEHHFQWQTPLDALPPLTC